MEPNSHKKKSFENWQESDDDEALSLSDLAINKHDHHPEKRFYKEHDQHFDFGGVNLPKHKMCNADDLFYRGQILPVSLPSGFMTRSVSYSRSEPVSATSSRSSSGRSHNSGTSGSSMSGSEVTGYKNTTRNRNQFYSYPSPKPQIRTRSFHQSNPKSSSKWSLLQLGPIKPQEIGLADLRNRSQRSHASRSRSRSSSNMKDENQSKSQSQMLFFGGCKCKYSLNVVESRVSLMVKPTKSLKEETRLSWMSKEHNDAVLQSSHLHFHSTK